jgi:hypothetical protein
VAGLERDCALEHLIRSQFPRLGPML